MEYLKNPIVASVLSGLIAVGISFVESKLSTPDGEEPRHLTTYIKLFCLVALIVGALMFALEKLPNLMSKSGPKQLTEAPKAIAAAPIQTGGKFPLPLKNNPVIVDMPDW